MFWGCFIALVTTAIAFSTRIELVGGAWADQFNLDNVQKGILFGAGIWPFAISIILFSLIIDKIGYKTVMIFSFICYSMYALFAYLAFISGDNGNAYNLLYVGSVILGLGNGTVEAYINPIVSTIFNKEKTKWLNILHAAWPGGLVIGGTITALFIAVDFGNWLALIALVALPSIIFFIMLINAEYPVNERLASGTSYKEMLAEFGTVGAFVASWLVVAQLNQVFGFGATVTWIFIIFPTLIYYAYCRSLGHPMMILLILLMIPLAITELGTDGWITDLMKAPLSKIGAPSILVLVYTASIMVILRFNVGPIVGKLGPLGLLVSAASLAIVGIYLLSFSTGLGMIFLAATIYGVGKTFFWPTMLGVVSEQFPKGGALSLNAVSGIGMLSVGILGVPLIGAFQERNVIDAISNEQPAVLQKVVMEKDYILGDYEALDPEKFASLTKEEREDLAPTIAEATQNALKKVTIFPFIMLISYIGLSLYFRKKGGYKPVDLISNKVAG